MMSGWSAAMGGDLEVLAENPLRLIYVEAVLRVMPRIICCRAALSMRLSLK